MELPQDSLNIFNSVINDMNALQSRYDSTISILNNKVRLLTAENQQKQKQINDLELDLQDTQNLCDKSLEKAQEFKIYNDRLIIENEKLTKDVQALTEQLHFLEQEKKEFSKVSHVVALEKENSKLKQEIEMLKEKNNTIDVYEKEIKGKLYYISCQDNSTIYNKNDDDSIGSIVGYIEKNETTQKFKVRWI